ncbi:MAG: putative DNA-binding domain-containing protein [Gammaproteobacteria bacterium]|nr:putative DNA-binding domain-containing protein [Gammaproteobacteria bacterium]
MDRLHSLQSDFQSFLLEGDARIQQRVTGTEKASLQVRLAIYHDAYRLRLIEALDSNFPVLHAWMGDAEFENLSLAYIKEYPSTHFSIRYFGHHLAEYLATNATYRDRPFLSEMAQLEWALSQAFDAPDSAVMALDDVANIPPSAWPQMRFSLHASVQLLTLQWNVPPIWKAINQHLHTAEKQNSCRGDTSSTPSSVPSPSQGEGWGEEDINDVPAPTLSEYPQSWLIWRQDLKNYFRSLPVDEAWALAAARDHNFAELCEGLCEWIDAQNVAPHAAGFLKQWITDGLIRKIDWS